MCWCAVKKLLAHYNCYACSLRFKPLLTTKHVITGPPTHSVGWPVLICLQCVCCRLSSSSKLEVHPYRKLATTPEEDWATCTEIWLRSRVWFLRYPCGQTDTQTHTDVLITVFITVFDSVCRSLNSLIVALCRGGGARNAKILSVWRHCQHGFTHGVNWRRSGNFSF